MHRSQVQLPVPGVCSVTGILPRCLSIPVWLISLVLHFRTPYFSNQSTSYRACFAIGSWEKEHREGSVPASAMRGPWCETQTTSRPWLAHAGTSYTYVVTKETGRPACFLPPQRRGRPAGVFVWASKAPKENPYRAPHRVPH